MKKIGKIKFCVIIFFLVFCIKISGVLGTGKLEIIPNSGYVYDGCYQPFVIKMDTDGTSTNAVDTKLIITGNFYTNPNPSYYKIIKNGQMENIQDLKTGESSNGNIDYLYINTYQSPNNPISGSNITIATLYLSPYNISTGYISFFYSGDFVNTDDSNISSGKNNNTQYEDNLGYVNSGEYTVSGYQFCEYRPYIISGFYWQYTNKTIGTSTNLVYTAIKAGPYFTNNLSLIQDNVYNIRTNTTGWTVWTNTSVKLHITGSYGVNFLTTGYINNDGYISASGEINTGWNTGHYFTITGNTNTGYFVFENYIGNSGQTFASGNTKFVHDFYIDVFWIDTVIPTNTGYFTGYISSTGDGYRVYTLSGKNFSERTSNEISGYHANWSSKDDEYKIISFSGTNPANQIYGLNQYDDYLNNTGYVVSSGNDFKLLHTINFNSPFVGTATIIDRAGNTGYHFFNLTGITPIVEYGIIVYPKSFVTGVLYQRNYGGSGMLYKLAIYSNFDTTGYNGGDETVIFDNIRYTGWIKSSSTGYATFTGYFDIGEYDVLVEPVNGLSTILTGVSLNPVSGLIDYRTIGDAGLAILGKYFSYYPSNTTAKYICPMTIDGNIVKEQLSTCPIKGDQITAQDISIWINIFERYSSSEYNTNTGSVGVFSGTFFTDIDEGGSYRFISEELTTPPVISSTMVYHPYDINADGTINVLDLNPIMYYIGTNTYKMPF